MGDFIDANEKNNTFGCCIDQNNLENGCNQVMKCFDFNKDIISQIDAYRVEIGLDKLQNGNMWNKILQMMLMRESDNDTPYQFDKLSICERQNYLKQCHKHCAMQLMDLENLSPKLQVILARLDRMIRT